MSVTRLSDEYLVALARTRAAAIKYPTPHKQILLSEIARLQKILTQNTGQTSVEGDTLTATVSERTPQ